MNYPAGPSVGLQNSDGTVGLCHVYNEWYPRVSAPLKAGTALRFEAVQLAGVEEPSVADAPQARVLSVGPNPCRGTALIRLSPAGRARTGVRIFSSDGRLVRLIAPQSSILNLQSSLCLVWDGCDASGALVGPGLYFAQAATDDCVQKLALVR